MAGFANKDLPTGDFSVHFIAEKFYPECVKTDKEGRKYNRAVPVIYRILRSTKLVLEVGNGIFFNGL